jgi:hypothetical protein
MNRSLTALCLLFLPAVLLHTDSAQVSGEASPETCPDRDAPPSAARLSSGAVTSEPLAVTHDELRQPVWRSDRLMVRPAEGASLEKLAHLHQTRVAAPVGPGGWGAVAVPSGEAATDLLLALRADPAVLAVQAEAITRGTSWDTGDALEDAVRYAQWFLKESRHPYWSLSESEQEKTGEVDLSGWVVAVLDSGVAYEDYTDDSGTYLKAESLSQTAFVDPWDFINDDAHPNDDHQHGTHITSLISSQGLIAGVAAGVTVMPVKVLDADNTGTETALVSGLYHAIDSGADVINMSLSFGAGYVPSDALLDALDAAHEAGIVMVAAAGNGAGERVTWPAASPWVIAVAATTLKGSDRKLKETSYSNNSPQVDISAPGGAVEEDADEDGLVDGLLAESFALNSPTQTGLWLNAGTSQAAAVVSGAAVHLLQAGAAPWQVRAALQLTANDNLSGRQEEGVGSGSLDLRKAQEAVEDQDDKIQNNHRYFAAILPYLKGKIDDDEVEPRALLSLVDESGALAKDMEVIGTVTGSSTEVFKCKTNGEGTCEVHLDKVARLDDSGELAALAWSWRVEVVVKDHISHHPGGLLFATDTLELIAAAMLSGEDDLALPALYWPDTDDEHLGDIRESYVVFDLSTTSVPAALLLSSESLSAAEITADELDLDGTGLADSPIGPLSIRRITLDGTGLADSPIGPLSLQELSFIALKGSGDDVSALGFHGLHLFQSTEGTGLSSSPLGFDSEPILLGRGAATIADLADSSMADILDGGWVIGSGYPGATLLEASGMVGVTVDWSEHTSASVEVTESEL